MSVDHSASPPMSTGARSRANARQPRRHKTAILVAQQIVQEITDRKLPPGAMLPSERQMLEDYGVARGTLREALRYLEVQGVITIRPGPGGGPSVNEVEPRALASVLAMILHLSEAPFSTILETRQLIEPASAAAAAARIDDARLEELRESMEVMDEVIDDAQAFLAENGRFHVLIARASGNKLFEMLAGALSWIIDATALGAEYDLKRRRVVVRAHRKIYEALQSGDPEAARSAMADHIDNFSTYMERNYKNVLDRPIRWDARVL